MTEPDLNVQLSGLAAAVRAGQQPMNDLIEAFRGSTLFVPSSSDPATQGFSPVLTDVDGQPHMVVAATPSQLSRTSELAAFAVTLSGASVLKGLRADTGVMVQVEDGSFALGPELLAEVRTRHAER